MVALNIVEPQHNIIRRPRIRRDDVERVMRLQALQIDATNFTTKPTIINITPPKYITKKKIEKFRSGPGAQEEGLDRDEPALLLLLHLDQVLLVLVAVGPGARRVLLLLVVFLPVHLLAEEGGGERAEVLPAGEAERGGGG